MLQDTYESKQLQFTHFNSKSFAIHFGLHLLTRYHDVIEYYL